MSEAAVSSGDLVQVVQRDGVVLAPIGSLPVPPAADMAALTKRVAALEARGNVALSGSLPVATLQIGTNTVQVAVTGLLAADRVAVQPVADLPAGLALAWARPKADGMLTVALDALAVLAIKSPIPILVTALR